MGSPVPCSFTYSASGALTGAVTAGGEHLTYTYDALGNLVSRSKDGALAGGYLYAPGITGPVAELGEDGDAEAAFVYATRSNVPDYMVKASRTYRLITDQIGSVRLVVDAETGSIEQEIEYDAFGRVTSDSAPGFQPFYFAGGIYDSATKLTHFGAREYDAELGRWTSADPISFAGGDANLYGYVAFDPVNFVDPSGLLRWESIKDSLPSIIAPGPVYASKISGTTIGLCAGANGSLGGYFGGQNCLLVTPSGQLSLTSSTASGVGGISEGEGSLGILISNAQCIEDLLGPSYGAGVGVGEAYASLGIDGDYSSTADGRGVTATTVSWSPGVRAGGFAAHVNASNTVAPWGVIGGECGCE